MSVYFLAGIPSRAVWPPSYQPMGDRPRDRKESLDSKNHAKQWFLSGHGRYVCLFS